MSSQSHPDPTAGPSRRSMLRGAGAAGAVGIAAAAGVGAVAAATRPTPAVANRPDASAELSADVKSGPLVVYLRDAESGELDVFAGTSHAVIRDPALVARLTHAVR